MASLALICSDTAYESGQLHLLRIGLVWHRWAKAAGVGAASLALALSAHAANVKLGADGGALVFDPSTVTIKAGDSVTWTNNVGFPHNVVFDEDNVPVRLGSVQRDCLFCHDVR